MPSEEFEDSDFDVIVHKSRRRVLSDTDSELEQLEIAIVHGTCAGHMTPLGRRQSFRSSS